ncbi:MAG: hypothetical protein RI883_1015 [Bacteroidota bacterium]|jgi:NAD(P)H-dependent FMN reductase
MKNILAIGGSTSNKSINKKLADHTALMFKDTTVQFYDLSLNDIPIFSVQLEAVIGMPELVLDFVKLMDEADFLVVSLAENNGNLNAGFKNLLDWVSRIKGRKTFADKPMLLMATSPGARGGASVLEIAEKSFKRLGADIKITFSLPSFEENFDEEKGIINPVILAELKSIVKDLN